MLPYRVDSNKKKVTVANQTSVPYAIDSWVGIKIMSDVDNFDLRKKLKLLKNNVSLDKISTYKQTHTSKCQWHYRTFVTITYYLLLLNVAIN